LGKFLGGIALENLGIFYDHLVYFTAIANILWPFGYFSPFGFFTKKNLATLSSGCHASFVNSWNELKM
jgi:hypothetical protein